MRYCTRLVVALGPLDFLDCEESWSEIWDATFSEVTTYLDFLAKEGQRGPFSVLSEFSLPPKPRCRTHLPILLGHVDGFKGTPSDPALEFDEETEAFRELPFPCGEEEMCSAADLLDERACLHGYAAMLVQWKTTPHRQKPRSTAHPKDCNRRSRC